MLIFAYICLSRRAAVSWSNVGPQNQGFPELYTKKGSESCQIPSDRANIRQHGKQHIGSPISGPRGLLGHPWDVGRTSTLVAKLPGCPPRNAKQMRTSEQEKIVSEDKCWPPKRPKNKPKTPKNIRKAKIRKLERLTKLAQEV